MPPPLLLFLLPSFLNAAVPLPIAAVIFEKRRLDQSFQETLSL